MNENRTPLKGLPALVYQEGLGTDCSSRGISATATEATVIGPIFAATPERLAVHIIKRDNRFGATCQPNPCTPGTTGLAVHVRRRVHFQFRLTVPRRHRLLRSRAVVRPPRVGKTGGRTLAAGHRGRSAAHGQVAL